MDGDELHRAFAAAGGFRSDSHPDSGPSAGSGGSFGNNDLPTSARDDRLLGVAAAEASDGPLLRALLAARRRQAQARLDDSDLGATAGTGAGDVGESRAAAGGAAGEPAGGPANTAGGGRVGARRNVDTGPPDGAAAAASAGASVTVDARRDAAAGSVSGTATVNLGRPAAAASSGGQADAADDPPGRASAPVPSDCGLAQAPTRAASSGLPPVTLSAFRGQGRGAWLCGAELRALVLRYQTQGAEESDGIGPEAEGLLRRALEDSTWGARATHMAALCSFLHARRRDFPLTDRSLVAFVGYLYACLATRSGPQLRGVSLAGYLSGIRSVHAALGLGALPTETESLLLAAAVAGYKKAADATVPPTSVRVAIPVHVLYKIMCRAQERSADRLCLRDTALLLTAVVFGLRPAGAESILAEHVVELSESCCELLISRLKGQTVAQALRRGAARFTPRRLSPASP